MGSYAHFLSSNSHSPRICAGIVLWLIIKAILYPMLTLTPTGAMNELFVAGPDAHDFPKINDYFNRAYHRDPEGFSREFEQLRREHPAFHSPESIAGYCSIKPYGYAGDFGLIDRLYMHYVGEGDHIARWDTFAQAQPAAVAVRNRKAYFINLMSQLTPGRVLNVASGPSRDVVEFLRGTRMRMSQWIAWSTISTPLITRRACWRATTASGSPNRIYSPGRPAAPMTGMVLRPVRLFHGRGFRADLEEAADLCGPRRYTGDRQFLG